MLKLKKEKRKKKKKSQIGLELITCYIYPSLITCYILNNLIIFKRTFWPPILVNINIYLRKFKNKHNFHLNRGIMVEIQIILQKILQNANVVSDYW